MFQEDNNQRDKQFIKLTKVVSSLERRIFDLEDQLRQIKETGKITSETEITNRDGRAESREEITREEIIETEKGGEGVGLEKVAENKKDEGTNKEDIESEIGMKWLGRIGAVALIFGMAFFLKYAFENDWIGETGRVVMGILAGLGLIGLGEFLRKKYLDYAQTLTGGGIAILYLSVYASSNFYHLIDQSYAFLAMIVITSVGAFLAVRYGKIGLATIAILGGLLTPLLLRESLDSQPWLFIYIFILNLGVLGVSLFRNWQGLNLLGLLGTLIVFTTWQSSFYNLDQLFLTVFFLTAIFAIYAIATLSCNIFLKKKASQFDMALVVLNAFIYFGISYSLLFKSYADWMGFFALAMALLYFIFAYVSRRFNLDDKYLTLFLPLLSIFFITIAAPIQFDGHWVTIAWIVEAVTLIWAGFYLNDHRIRMFAWAIFALATARLFFLDAKISDLENYIIVFNKRFLTFIIGAVSAFLIYRCYSIYQKIIKQEEIKAKTIILVVANFLLLFILSAEISTFFDKRMEVLPKAPDCQVRTFQRQTGEYVTNSRCEREHQEYYKKRDEIYVERKETKNATNTSLSILWGIYAIILLAFGIIRKNKNLRLMGIGLFGVVVFKLFFYDLWGLGGLYRIISSITLGIILLVASFAYHKYRDKIREII